MATVAYNTDCMEAMRQMQDGAFDLAIVDPVYGDVTKGGYMKNNHGQRVGTGKANQKGYHDGLWKQGKTGAEYFSELRRVSKAQIIWGGNTLLRTCRNRSAGSCGINCIMRE